ncbi:hypothetical protein [Giesbergeria anulus]|uniref:Uncharacterized protein n=1 Tax=Giesbergeria anulus TaxID=180197 RepID=A0A1H9NJW7_9BURK|nr:hypothetical protein [Giesbergeria anulus]SER36260.1 hypothetical protein SAMN02982919_02244 [Giesbergeria anulus]
MTIDVIAVNMCTNKVRLLAENKSERNAESIILMAVQRLGCDTEFFADAPAGAYKDGDTWRELDKETSESTDSPDDSLTNKNSNLSVE